jgi:hypothetical protein
LTHVNELHRENELPHEIRFVFLQQRHNVAAQIVDRGTTGPVKEFKAALKRRKA